MGETLTAAAAARRLGVKPATLYTYVSRGWLSSLPGSSGRTRRYLRQEVEELATRTAAAKGHAAVAAGAVGWGQPVVDTAISDIRPDGPAYRGRSFQGLLDLGFEAACDQLWGRGSGSWAPPGLPCTLAPGPGDAAPAARLAAWLAGEALADPDRHGAAEAEDLARARRLVWAAAVSLCTTTDRARAAATAPSVAASLAWALVDRPAPGLVQALDGALITCADHELNASTFAARVAAGTGADLHACLVAGLCALSGPRHGGLSARVEALLDEVGAPGRARRVLRARLARGEQLPGLGHRLYPEGDPRFPVLLDLARAAPAATEGGALVEAVLVELEAMGQPPPNLDLGLVALGRAWGLPDGASQAIFAVGRLGGYVAHALEQRATGQLIRPRARYTGPVGGS